MEAVVRVLGIGNVLMGDDGLGPWVAHQLSETFDFPPEVAVVDVGTPGGDLLPFLSDADLIVLVDVVKATGAPGELRTYNKAEILKVAPQQRVGPHDPGLRESLLTLEFGGGAPKEVFMVGVIPERIEQGNQLSPTVQGAVGPAVEAVVEELRRRGLVISPKPGAVVKTPWWATEG